MLYTMSKWKKMILICLWPYAMRHSNDVLPLEKFSGIQVAPKLWHFHAFGCPTYILDNALQSGQGTPKWKHCSRLGVYLGPLPSHAWSVTLVLNLRTGHVSPQFHLKFDDFFEMFQDKPTNLDAPKPEWKYLSGFAVRKGPAKSGIKGVMDSLLVPWRGPTMTTTMPSPPNEQPANQQQGLQIPAVDDDNETNLPMPSLPAHQTVPQLPQLQLEQPSPAAHQTCSGRVICNTPHYEQSISQRSQGLVAWEILLDQDETCLQLPHSMQYKRLSRTRLPLRPPTTQTYCSGTK